ncbi:hypothetical protein LZ30DRAFT_773785 [Colletotrichum cereale]|nr:hypothetical protein LZ30DRAFT_773785 [Colletotrichum cereale]
MRWLLVSMLWLLATLAFALPSGHRSSDEFNLSDKRTSEPGIDLHDNIYYTEKAVLPPLQKRYSATRAIADGHFTREEMLWLYEKSLIDVSIDGLKETTAALKGLFGKNNIPWVISGGWALILYGQPERNTPDIDIVVQTTMSELKELLEVDGRFVVPADNWWPDDAHLQVYFKNKQGQYFV